MHRLTHVPLRRFLLVILLPFALSSAVLIAQLGPADYERALNLREKYKGLVNHLPDGVEWIEGSDQFVYRRTIPGGHEFVLVDAEKQSRQPAFDHARLAEALSKALGEPVKPEALPFDRFHMEAGGKAFAFERGREHWRCDLAAYTCAKQPGPSEEPADDDGGYDSTPRPVNDPAHASLSPDGNWLVFVENYNVALRPAHAKPSEASEAEKQTVLLSMDGSEGNYYAFDTLAWSPDSKHLAAYRIRPGYKREVHYIESSPADQFQPKHSTMVYPKAGDLLPLFQPVLFDVAARRELPIDSSLFSNPYELMPFAWWKDGRGFTFECNQRGHQIYRVIEVDAATGKARVLIEEASATFINYEPLTRDQFDHGKYFRKDLADGKEILWASERDGWEHVYLFDGHTGALRRQITRGEWVVRAVDYVDEANRQLYFEASGMNPDEDPYYVHGYRIGFDGTGLTALTPLKADHTASYSADGKYLVDTYSQLDLAPVMELRRAADGSLAMAAGDCRRRAAEGRGLAAGRAVSCPGPGREDADLGHHSSPAQF